jgi:hypothetical protein
MFDPRRGVATRVMRQRADGADAGRPLMRQTHERAAKAVACRVGCVSERSAGASSVR